MKLPAAVRGWRWHRASSSATSGAPKAAAVLQSRLLLDLAWLAHGFSTRLAGTGKAKVGDMRDLNLGFTESADRAAIERNRAAFAAALGACRMQLVSIRQIHSDIVHRVDCVPREALRGDAMITRTPGLLLTVQTADCVPVLLADTRGRAVAAVHAGWRGTLARIVQKTIGKMRMEFGTDPADVMAAIGPAIARCSYEVGAEVVRQFAGQFPPAREWLEGPIDRLLSEDSPNPLKWLMMTPPGHDPPLPTAQLDLIAANGWQLADCGVREENISAANLCTACHTDVFFSYRREGKAAGRMMAAIGIL